MNQNKGKVKKPLHDTGEPSRANLYSMLIARLRSLPLEILDLHLQQRHTVLTPLAMEKAARLYKHLHPIGQSTTSPSRESGRCHIMTVPNDEKDHRGSKAISRDHEREHRGFIAWKLAGNQIITRMEAGRNSYSTRGQLGRLCPSDVVS